jgi:hypothetical protein
MNTYTHLSNRATLTQTDSLPTRQQLEAFLRSKGITAKKLEQMSSWEQIQLTHEYQKLAEKSTQRDGRKYR